MSTLIEISNLKKHFPVGGQLFRKSKARALHAVDGVSINILERETLGLIGESGCGKSTFARLLLRLVEPTEGSVRFMGRNIYELDKKEVLKLRRQMQMVFQDPMASLNPRKTIRKILSQPFSIHKTIRKDEIEGRVLELLDTVGLTPPEQFVDRHPHEFSGGQRQRIGIARAISLNPRFIAADEPVSALDVSIRAQILELINELKKNFDLTLLFITHDLAVARFVCSRAAVMYLGKVVEIAKVEDLFHEPLHPYTKALLSATPIPNPRRARSQERTILKGNVPSQIDLPPGCRFSERCPQRQRVCTEVEPNLSEAGKDHFVACSLYCSTLDL